MQVRATSGVLSYVWESRFGPRRIEVCDEKAFVDGNLLNPPNRRQRGALRLGPP